MSAFTITNLREDVPDTADRFAPQLELRFGRRYLESEHLGVTYLRYAPGYRLPLGHRHSEQEEAYVVVGGSGRIRIEDRIEELRTWDVVRVAPGLMRGFEAGPDGLELVAIGSDRPEGGDATTIEDWWPA